MAREARKRTPRIRMPRGHEACRCCDGYGTHDDRTQCHRCEGDGHLTAGSKKPFCGDQGGSQRRTAALQEGARRPHGDYEMRYGTEDTGARKPAHVIEVHHPEDGKVGFMRWMGTAPYAIDKTEVHEDHRRQGLATAMWDWAQEDGRPKPSHSKQRTDAGDAWARSVGGPLPRREAADRIGEPFEFEYARNTISAPKMHNGEYDQDIEPHGRYMTVHEPMGNYVDSDRMKWEFGHHRFENPLHLDAEGWKQSLSEQHGGKTGRELSQAVRNAGHDGIVTHETSRGRSFPGEIVDLTGFRPREASLTSDYLGITMEEPSEGGPHGGHATGRRAAGRGKPRRDSGGQDGLAGGPDRLGGPEEGAGPRRVELHPGAAKDLRALDKPDQKRIASAIDSLSNGEPMQTHALTGPLKGWHSTKASRGHRLVHQNTEDGGIHIGYIGLHDYGTAIRRLTSRDAPQFVHDFKPTGPGTDWDRVHPTLPKTVHRGAGFLLKPEDHAYVHDASIPAEERGRHLIHLMNEHAYTGGIGKHWSTDPWVAHGFAASEAGKHSDAWKTEDPDHKWGTDEDGDPKWRPATMVMLRAKTPAREDLDPDHHDIWGHRVDYETHNEKETPIIPGRPVHVTGMSWGTEDDPAPDDDGEPQTLWQHHHDDYYGEPAPPHHAYPHQADFEKALKHKASRPLPTDRIFGPTYGLDHRLFTGVKLHPDVIEAIMGRLDKVLRVDSQLVGSNWMDYIEVYLAGSEASEWTSPTLEGNNDFDTLLGVNYDELRGNDGRGASAEWIDKTNDEINDVFNDVLRRFYNDENWAAPFGGIWHLTGYVNGDAYDIRDIKPYAAYDLNKDAWAVKPPHLPEWSPESFPEGPALWREAEAVADQIEAILDLPEPYRTQQGASLYDHLHEDRHRAFGDHGEGWYDPGNVIEKYLDQLGLWAKLLHLKKNAEHETFDDGEQPFLEAMAVRGWEGREITNLSRGMGVDLPEELHAYVHDESVPRKERAARLLDHVSGKSFGMHWTDDPDVARGFASKEARKEHLDEPDTHSTPVVIHAQAPEVEHIETDKATLRKRRVRDYEDTKDAESEVPLKAGAPVHVLGVSWAHPDTWRQREHSHRFKRSYFDEPITKQAIDATGSMMVAFVPPDEVLDHLVQEDGEERHELHITLLYLGKESAFTPKQVTQLPVLVQQWAKTQQPLKAATQGAGTFLAKDNHKDSHVLWASVNIPHVSRAHDGLVDFLRGHGLPIKEQFGYIPHITLRYDKYHVRFLPKIEPMSWDITEVWFCRNKDWIPFKLGG